MAFRLLLGLGLMAVATAQPRFVHLALTGNRSEMAVSWFTTAPLESIVDFGVAPSNYTSRVFGRKASYNESIGYVHDAVMANLEPATTYYYRVGDGGKLMSEEYHFRTQTADFSPFTVPMYGDYGVRNANFTAPDLAAQSENGLIDWVYHVGDIGYANDYESGRYEEIWNAWFDENAKLLPYTPYMVCPGNHEYHSGAPILKYSLDFAEYRYRFRMPWNESGSTAGNNMWFSFDYHNVHFVSVSTETDFPGAPEAEKLFGDQLTWLRKDLASTDKPWIIVGGHRPMYSASAGSQANGKPIGDPLTLLNAMEDIFHEHHVDLFVVGHMHAYQRQYPTYKGVRTGTSYHNANSTVHMVVGSAGCEEFITASWNDPRPDWNAYRWPEATDDHTAFGYAELHVFNDTHIRWRFIQSQTKKIGDEIIISKDAGRRW